MEGLRRLEYRGYDSAGIAVISNAGLQRCRRLGKVAELQKALDQQPLAGLSGIAHTRWATHGAPSENNAHPHRSADEVALVHNGIIENHAEIKQRLSQLGYAFVTETDTETVAHLVHHHLQHHDGLLAAVQAAITELRGAYALLVMSAKEPDTLVLARCGCPVVVGRGIGENFVASDVAALLPVTRQFIFLEEGDVGVVTRSEVSIYDHAGQRVERETIASTQSADAGDKGGFRHFMLKEIHEQPTAVSDTLEGRIADGRVLEAAFGPGAEAVLEQVRAIHIIACGTSFHAGLVARYWIEQYCRIPCSVEIASEYRYRAAVVPERCLFITLSQSGETADTLAAVRIARQRDYLATMTICNVAESSLVRESDLVLMTQAGLEIGVASTKAFTTQLVALAMLTITLGRHRGMPAAEQARLVGLLEQLPAMIGQVLSLDGAIEQLAGQFAERHHALFLGRGTQQPVAMEGALKLKEISYIHAEAYPAGELKHGPLALVDEDMPVVTVAPDNELLEKLKSNLQEVRARGGQLFIIADPRVAFEESAGMHLLRMPAPVDDFQSPILYTVPLQLLAYHVAVLKGTDIDQPRNLAKSVTVE